MVSASSSVLSASAKRARSSWSHAMNFARPSAVEREFGRLKHEFGLAVRVRRLPKVRLTADMCKLARLGLALERARAVPLAA